MARKLIEGIKTWKIGKTTIVQVNAKVLGTQSGKQKIVSIRIGGKFSDKFLEGIKKASPNRAFRMAFQRSKEGQSIMHEGARENFRDRFIDSFNNTQAQRDEMYWIIDQLTDEQFHEVYLDNKELFEKVYQSTDTFQEDAQRSKWSTEVFEQVMEAIYENYPNLQRPKFGRGKVR